MSSTAKPLKALVSASIRGLLSLCPASVSTLPGQLGDEALDVLGDRAAHPVLGYGVGHAVAAEQHLLVVERQAGDLPAHREALEEQLRAAAPGVVLAGSRRRRALAELGDRRRAERLAQGQDVALDVAVVDRRRLLSRPPLLPLRHLPESAT